MRSEIICVGTELLLGEIVNTNAHWLASRLSSLGVNHFFQSVVGDNHERLSLVIRTALDRSDIIFIGGGLGPTTDDITHEVLATTLNLKLVCSDEILEMLAKRFSAQGRIPSASNNSQALIPDGSLVIENSVGTAPGIEIDFDHKGSKKLIYTMPGVPSELKTMFDNVIVNRLSERNIVSLPAGGIKKNDILIWGIPESEISSELAKSLTGINPSVATYSSSGGVRVRLAISKNTSNKLLEEANQLVMKRFGDYVVSANGDCLQKQVFKTFKEKRKTCSVAESCTGGGLGASLTDLAGSSEIFDGGVISYSNELKMRILGVREQTLTKFGAVSEHTAAEMSLGVLKLTKSNVAISITGIAGPGGGSEEKPLGTVCFGMSFVDQNDCFVTYTTTKKFGNLNRDTIRERAINSSLFFLLTWVRQSKILPDLMSIFKVD